MINFAQFTGGYAVAYKIEYKYYHKKRFITANEFLELNKEKFENFNDARRCLNIAKYQIYAIEAGFCDKLVHNDGKETYLFLEDWNLIWYYYYCNNTCSFYKIK